MPGDLPAIDRPCCGTALRKASRRLAQLYDSALAPVGLKATQYAILIETSLPGDGPLTMQVLAQRLVMDRSTLGHNLRPLERDGLLTVEPAPGDRRSRQVALTRLGRARLRSARRHWEKAQAKVTEILGSRLAGELRATLLDIAYDERFSL